MVRLFFVGWLVLAVSTAHAASNCKLMKIAEWQVKPQTGRLFVEGEINGQKVDILLDTGAVNSFVVRAAADRLGLTRHEALGYRSYGIGGETHVEYAVIDELKIGTATRKNWRTFVLGEHDLERPYAFLVGYDFFDQVDVEFDLANNAVRIFQAKDCGDVPLAYWAKGGASEAKLEVDNEKPGILVPVKLNGKPFLAEMDTGTSRSIVSRLVATSLGLGPDSGNAKAAGQTGGLGAARSDVWIGTFESFSIADELIRNPSIGFTNLEIATTATGSRLAAVRELRDMLLGVDFLKAHRVLVAHSQRKLYFTYTGGPVFTRPQAPQSSGQRP
jgi:clan AA aspartic protease (TIGR02281 family)